MKRLLVAMGAGASLFAVTAQGSGFAIIEQSVSGLGSAFAGGSASAEDASTVFFNPAGMMKLGDQATSVAALHSIAPSAEFTDTGSGPTPPLSGGDGGDAGHGAIVPNLYYVGQNQNGMRFGLGIGAPFGMGTEYDADWKGRYYGIKSELKVVNINPAVALKASDKLSIGVGLNLQTASATLTSAVNVGGNGVTSPVGVCAGLAFFGFPTAGCIGAGDADAEISGSSVGWGVNYGVLYQMGANTDIGFHYRSGVRHELDGDADFTNTPTELSNMGYLVDTDAEAVMNLPATASLSLNHGMGSVRILADATWTNWEQMSELRVSYDTGNQGDTVDALGWKNTGRYSIGMLYSVNDAMTIRAGVARDESPVPNEERRSVRVPDGDRTWLALGLGYKLGNGMAIDAGFASIAVDSVEIDKNETFKGKLVGEYDNSVNIISVSGSMSF
ncbi:MAG: outer membrane protein transport protein [Gammaproteobacteria bacterium]|nr:outer membrane protein transport protein [Gammaproteobacteria bacterium]